MKISWRHHMKVHPACELFPPMSQAELKELGEDIKKNGLIDTIKIVDGPMVIDGRNRLDTMEAAGVKIFTDAVDESDNYGPGVMMKKTRGTK